MKKDCFLFVPPLLTLFFPILLTFSPLAQAEETIQSLETIAVNGFELHSPGDNVLVRLKIRDLPAEKTWVNFKVQTRSGEDVLYTSVELTSVGAEVFEGSIHLDQRISDQETSDTRNEFYLFINEADYDAEGRDYATQLSSELEQLLRQASLEQFHIAVSFMDGKPEKQWAPTGKDYFRAGGFEVAVLSISPGPYLLSNEIESVDIYIRNQADWMIYVGHGESCFGKVATKRDIEIHDNWIREWGGPEGPPSDNAGDDLALDQAWQDDLDGVLIFGCAVLDIRDYGMHYDKDYFENAGVPCLVDPDFPSPGLRWEKVVAKESGPATLLGFIFKAPKIRAENNPGDEFLNGFLTRWISKPSFLEDDAFLMAWMELYRAGPKGIELAAIQRTSEETMYHVGLERYGGVWKSEPISRGTNCRHQFRDVPALGSGIDWRYYSEPVYKLCEKTAIDPANAYRPDQPATRAEFLKMALAAVAAPIPRSQGSEPFTDVHIGDWFFSVVSYAKQQGIVTGYSDGTFRPNQSLTRFEAAKILVMIRSQHQDQVVEVPCENAGASQFLDAAEIKDSEWFEYVDSAARSCMIVGKADGRFSGNESINRADAAKMLYCTYSGSTSCRPPD